MRKLSVQELNRIDIDTFKKTKKYPICVVLDNIRSANNVGSVFRTCDAFLIDKIYLCGYTPKMPHKDIQKTALGSTESVDWEYFEKVEDSIISLKELGYCIVAIEQADQSVMLNDFIWSQTEKYALIFGNEVNGISESVISLIDYCIEVPQFGTKHSLNISVCAGVVLWDAIKPFF